MTLQLIALKWRLSARLNDFGRNCLVKYCYHCFIVKANTHIKGQYFAFFLASLSCFFRPSPFFDDHSHFPTLSVLAILLGNIRNKWPSAITRLTAFFTCWVISDLVLGKHNVQYIRTVITTNIVTVVKCN